MKTKILLLVLALQCAWILGVVIVKETNLSSGQLILLETQPIDPRDELRGDYLALNYKISDVPLAVFSPAIKGDLPEGLDVYVTLVKAGEFYAVARASTAPFRPAANEVLLRGQAGWGGWLGWHAHNTDRIHVRYGLERFYIREGTGRVNGKLTAQAAVSHGGRATLKEIFVDGVPFAAAAKATPQNTFRPNSPSPTPPARPPQPLIQTNSPSKIVTPVAVASPNPDDEAVLRATLDIQRKQFGNDSTNAAAVLEDLANALRAKSKLAEAESDAREALFIQRKFLGDDHLFVANTLGVLSSTLFAEGKFAEAESTRRENLAIRRKQLGDANPRVAVSLEALAGVLQAENKFAEAEVSLREALAIRQKVFGGQDSKTLDVRVRLNEILKLEGKSPE